MELRWERVSPAVACGALNRRRSHITAFLSGRTLKARSSDVFFRPRPVEIFCFDLGITSEHLPITVARDQRHFLDLKAELEESGDAFMP